MGAAKQPDYARLPEDDRQSCDEYVPREFLRTRRDRHRWTFYGGCFLFGVVIGALLLKMAQGLPWLADWDSPKARLHRLLQSTFRFSIPSLVSDGSKILRANLTKSSANRNLCVQAQRSFRQVASRLKWRYHRVTICRVQHLPRPQNRIKLGMSYWDVS